MIEIPSQVLRKLLCVQCGGYLSCGPLVLNEKNEQLCGRCFRILPDQIKSLCLRQIGLEAVAEILTFPCKYNTQGCTYTFPWNSGVNHETTCHYRNNSLPLQETNNNIENNCQEIYLNILCLNTYQNEDKLKIHLDMSGKNGNQLCLNKEKVKLSVELAVSTEVTPKVTYSYVNIEKHVDDHVYDTISSISQDVKCANCQKSVLTTEVFHCGFGHSLCKFCKSSSCTICGVLPNSSPQYFCKNYSRGCRQPFPTLEISKHETDCEFNDFKCRLCDFIDSLDNLVKHFVLKHDCILSNELTITLTKQDKEWYFNCYDSLFHCKYYYLEDNIEFIINYVGSNDVAVNHKYEVSLTSAFNKVVTKSTRCLGWNEVSLEKGVTFQLNNAVVKNLQARIIIL